MYDAYSLILDIFGKSKSQIIIIDNYAGKELLDLLRIVDMYVNELIDKDNYIKRKMTLIKTMLFWKKK